MSGPFNDPVLDAFAGRFGMSQEERETRDAFSDWLLTRPQCVQDLAAEFEFDSIYMVKGRQAHVVGWDESDGIMLSYRDPAKEYDLAIQKSFTLQAPALRGRKPIKKVFVG